MLVPVYRIHFTGLGIWLVRNHSPAIPKAFFLGASAHFPQRYPVHNKNRMLYLVRCFYKRQCIQVMVWECTSQKFTSEWYDEISYFSVCSKADINELNLPHGRWVINVWSSLPHNVDVMSLLYLSCSFYRAMLCIRGTSHGPVSVSVCLSVCLSQVGVLLNRLNRGLHKQHRTIPQRL